MYYLDFLELLLKGIYKNIYAKSGFKEDRNHSTQKPVKLIERLVIASSNEGMLVLDPFMGNGTTAVAARKLRRYFIGFEVDKKYYDYSLSRISQKTL